MMVKDGWKVGWMPAALTAKGSEMREVDMAWDDYSIWEPRNTEYTEVLAWDDISLIGPIRPIAEDELVEWLFSGFQPRFISGN